MNEVDVGVETLLCDEDDVEVKLTSEGLLVVPLDPNNDDDDDEPPFNVGSFISTVEPLVDTETRGGGGGGSD